MLPVTTPWQYAAPPPHTKVIKIKMAVVAIKELVACGPAISKALVGCTEGVSALTKCFQELTGKIQSALKVIDELEGSVVELRTNTLECRTLLSKAYDCACVFMDRVEKCLDYGDLKDTRREEIKANATSKKSIVT